MGTQKNRLDEMVLLSSQNTFRLMDKKIKATLHQIFLLNWPYVSDQRLCYLLSGKYNDYFS